MIGNEEAVRRLEHVNVMQRQEEARLVAEAVRMAKSKFRDEAVASAAQLFDTGHGAFVGDVSATLPDGTTDTIAGNKLRETAVATRMEQIARKYGDDQVGMIDRQIKLLTDNGISEYEPWRRVLVAGAAASTSAALSNPSGETATPPATQMGYELAKRIKSVSVALYDKLTDEATRDLYDTAMASELYDGTQPADALATARRSIDQPTMLRLSGQQIDTLRLNLASQIGTNLKNQPEMLAEALPMAVMLMRRGVSQDAAMQAAKDTTVKRRFTVNGWSSKMPEVVPTGLKDDFVTALEGMIDDTAKARSIDKGALSVAPDQSGRFWTVINKESGAVFAGAGASMATTDLLTMANQMAQKREADRRDATKRGEIEKAARIKRFNETPLNTMGMGGG